MNPNNSFNNGNSIDFATKKNKSANAVDLVTSHSHADNNHNKCKSAKQCHTTKEEKKKVRWHLNVRVVLIPTRDEYEHAGLGNFIWWNEDDYTQFRDSAAFELKRFVEVMSMDLKEAIKILYQPYPNINDFEPLLREQIELFEMDDYEFDDENDDDNDDNDNDGNHHNRNSYMNNNCHNKYNNYGCHYELASSRAAYCKSPDSINSINNNTLTPNYSSTMILVKNSNFRGAESSNTLSTKSTDALTVSPGSSICSQMEIMTNHLNLHSHSSDTSSSCEFSTTNSTRVMFNTVSSTAYNYQKNQNSIKYDMISQFMKTASNDETPIIIHSALHTPSHIPMILPATSDDNNNSEQEHLHEHAIDSLHLKDDNENSPHASHHPHSLHAPDSINNINNSSCSSCSSRDHSPSTHPYHQPNNNNSYHHHHHHHVSINQFPDMGEETSAAVSSADNNNNNNNNNNHIHIVGKPFSPRPHEYDREHVVTFQDPTTTTTAVTSITAATDVTTMSSSNSYNNNNSNNNSHVASTSTAVIDSQPEVKNVNIKADDTTCLTFEQKLHMKCASTLMNQQQTAATTSTCLNSTHVIFKVPVLLTSDCLLDNTEVQSLNDSIKSPSSTTDCTVSSDTNSNYNSSPNNEASIAENDGSIDDSVYDLCV